MEKTNIGKIGDGMKGKRQTIETSEFEIIPNETVRRLLYKMPSKNPRGFVSRISVKP